MQTMLTEPHACSLQLVEVATGAVVQTFAGVSRALQSGAGRGMLKMGSRWQQQTRGGTA